MKVLLANLANDAFGVSPGTVPLECGYLKAYAHQQIGNDELEDIEIFRTAKTLVDAVERSTPDLIGMAWYQWNTYLTAAVVSYISERYPDIQFVYGGPNVPISKEGCRKALLEDRHIDYLIPLEGEIPFVALLKELMLDLNFRSTGKEVLGVYYLDASGLVIGPEKVPNFTKDINNFPSPYLLGLLDEFLEDPELMPVLQMTRGCPYSCAYCVSGSYTDKSVRGFEMERVKAEIEYLQANAANRSIRLADENYGLLERDVEVSRFIGHMHEKTGYPAAVRAYTNKAITKRMKQVLLNLRQLIPMNISMQSLQEGVLARIKRTNLSHDAIIEAVRWARENDIMVTTEMIFGLPGETYESYMDNIDKSVKYGFDSLASGPLMMLKEIEVSRDGTYNEYDYKTKYSLAEKGYTKFYDFESIEIDAWAVENKYFSLEEYIRYRKFMFLFDIFLLHGYFKEMLYMLDNNGIKISLLINTIIDNPKAYPEINQRLGVIERSVSDTLYDTEEDVKEAFRKMSVTDGSGHQTFSSATFSILQYKLKGELIRDENIDQTLSELRFAALEIFNPGVGVGSRAFEQQLDAVLDCARIVVVPFWKDPEMSVVFESNYDFPAWYRSNYQIPLTEVRLNKARSHQFTIRSMSEYQLFRNMHRSHPFAEQAEMFFRTFRTNNIRRFHVDSISRKHSLDVVQ
ncbi:MAG: hypothetical protein CMO98_05900 [Woeseia sp.]|nr:hypothetical protein [Woeseia sp.]|tara:strand:+ start:2442 stop:4499 length:2058 start_codon:yes stop_codon:yes gene_type:complete